MVTESALPIHMPVLYGHEVLFNISSVKGFTELTVKNYSGVAESGANIPEIHVSTETKDKTNLCVVEKSEDN